MKEKKKRGNGCKSTSRRKRRDRHKRDKGKEKSRKGKKEEAYLPPIKKSARLTCGTKGGVNTKMLPSGLGKAGVFEGKGRHSHRAAWSPRRGEDCSFSFDTRGKRTRQKKGGRRKP